MIQYFRYRCSTRQLAVAICIVINCLLTASPIYAALVPHSTVNLLAPAQQSHGESEENNLLKNFAEEYRIHQYAGKTGQTKSSFPNYPMPTATQWNSGDKKVKVFFLQNGFKLHKPLYYSHLALFHLF